jgi:hypothetical protein
VQLGDVHTSRCRFPGNAAVVRIRTSLSGSWHFGQWFLTSNLGTGLDISFVSPPGLSEPCAEGLGGGNELVA